MRCRAASPGRTRTSTTWCCCAPTARRPTCSRSWSTITTWASPTSSAATTISPTAARQTQIYQALGWPVPVMAHIPLIHGPDGAKLSKRHGALAVDAYRAMGYLPAAMRNYLVRLGWSHGDQEIFSTEEMIAAFDLAQIGRGAGALRLRQAREPQRPLHSAERRRRSARRARGRAAAYRRRRRDRGTAHPGAPRKAARRHAGPQGAGQDPRRTRRRGAHFLLADRPIARRRQGERPADAGGPPDCSPSCAACSAPSSPGRRKRSKLRCAPMRSAAGSSSARWHSRCGPR